MKPIAISKTTVIRFRVTPDEKQRIQAAAAKAGQQLSTFARNQLQQTQPLN